MTVAAPVAAATEGGPQSGRGARGGRRRGRWLPYWLLAPGTLWLTVFFIVPMVTLVGTSLQTGSLDAGYSLTWHWSNYTDVLSTYSSQFFRSLLYAGLATLAAIAIAYPLAYTIAFKSGRWKNFLLVLVIAPFFTSFLVRTLAWETILSDTGFVVRAFRTLHIINIVGNNGRLLATPLAVVCGLTYNFLPFMTLPLYASLEKIDPRLIEAATDLYCTPFTAFRKVTWKLSMPGVVAGTLLTFIPAAGDYVNVQFLGSPQQQMIGNVIQSRFLVVNDYPGAAALSFSLMVVILVLVVAYVRRSGTEELV
ncbi:MAG TPA: ABC transporter permease [Mycobacteriales bacterium]|nr:ABC transporter permease [Mycobacteriales bacterium]